MTFFTRCLGFAACLLLWGIGTQILLEGRELTPQEVAVFLPLAMLLVLSLAMLWLADFEYKVNLWFAALLVVSSVGCMLIGSLAAKEDAPSSFASHAAWFYAQEDHPPNRIR